MRRTHAYPVDTPRPTLEAKRAELQERVDVAEAAADATISDAGLALRTIAAWLTPSCDEEGCVLCARDVEIAKGILDGDWLGGADDADHDRLAAILSPTTRAGSSRRSSTGTTSLHASPSSATGLSSSRLARAHRKRRSMDDSRSRHMRTHRIQILTSRPRPILLHVEGTTTDKAHERLTLALQKLVDQSEQTSPDVSHEASEEGTARAAHLENNEAFRSTHHAYLELLKDIEAAKRIACHPELPLIQAVEAIVEKRMHAAEEAESKTRELEAEKAAHEHTKRAAQDTIDGQQKLLESLKGQVEALGARLAEQTQKLAIAGLATKGSTVTDDVTREQLVRWLGLMADAIVGVDDSMPVATKEAVEEARGLAVLTRLSKSAWIGTELRKYARAMDGYAHSMGKILANLGMPSSVERHELGDAIDTVGVEVKKLAAEDLLSARAQRDLLIAEIEGAPYPFVDPVTAERFAKAHDSLRAACLRSEALVVGGV